MNGLYLKIDEMPTISPKDITVITVKGQYGYISTKKYEVLDLDEHDKAVRQEFWDIIGEIMEMDYGEMYKLFGSSNAYSLRHLNPEEIVEKYKAWKEYKQNEDEINVKLGEMRMLEKELNDLGCHFKVVFD